MRKGIPILNRHNEKKYVDAYKPSEVKEYRLTKEELAKYGKPENNIDIPLVLNETDWKNTKVLRKDVSRMKKSLKLKTMELVGEVMKVRVQDGVISLVKDGQAIKINEKEIDQMIEELKQLKNIVEGA